jgi:hypothetical protein
MVWRPELIQGTIRSRHPEINEAVTANPLAALEKYLTLKPELAELGSRLLARAEELMAEEASP